MHLCEYTALHVSVFFGAMALVLSHPVVKTGPGDGHYIHFACDTMPGKCTTMGQIDYYFLFLFWNTQSKTQLCEKSAFRPDFRFLHHHFRFSFGHGCARFVVTSKDTHVIFVTLQVFCFVGKQILKARGRCSHE